jgi:hypothetical protein
MTRLGLPSSICIASLLACGAQVPPAVESPERSPDLVVATAAITLAPSGGDDTAALQAALDRATASG